MDIREITYSYYVKNREKRSLPEEWDINQSFLEIGPGIDNYSESTKYYVAADRDFQLAQKISKCMFVQADANSLPFKLESFDYFIASSILEHLSNPQQTLLELNRICRFGGLVLVPTLDSFPFLYDPINWFKKARGKEVANFGIGGFGHISMWYKDDWVQMFSNAGFKLEYETAYQIDLFQALEFFLASIFFSKNEYIELMDKTRKRSKKERFMRLHQKKIVNFLELIYRIFYAADIKLKGPIGYGFRLSKT